MSYSVRHKAGGRVAYKCCGILPLEVINNRSENEIYFNDEQVIESGNEQPQFFQIPGREDLGMRIEICVDMQYFFTFQFLI